MYMAMWSQGAALTAKKRFIIKINNIVITIYAFLSVDWIEHVYLAYLQKHKQIDLHE